MCHCLICDAHCRQARLVGSDLAPVVLVWDLQAHQPDYYSCGWSAMFMNGEAEMPYDCTLSRRALLRSAALTTAGWWATALPVRAANPTVVGFIYVGP
jgi:hypothetical protein